MSKDLGDMILEGAREALDYMNGKPIKGNVRQVTVHVPDTIDVAAIRRKFGLSRPRFAKRFGFSLPTLTKWERGERKPDGPARALLLVIEKEPEAVERALTAA